MNGGFARNWDVLRSAWAELRNRHADDTACDETAFLPANLEIMQTPPSPLGRALLLSLCGMVVVALLWSIIGALDIVVTAPGRTLPRANIQTVTWGGSGDTSDGVTGVVRAIHVTDGQAVTKGQLLMELDPTLSGADAAQARQNLSSAHMAQARSHALVHYLATGTLKVQWPAGTSPVQAQAETGLLRSSVAEYEAKVGALAAQRAATRQQAVAARTEKVKIAETLAFLDKELAIRRELADKGYQSKIMVYQLEQQRIERVRNMQLQDAEAARAEAAMRGIDQQIRQLREELSRGSLANFVQAGDEAMLRREEMTKVTRRNSLLQIRAPVAGTVEQLQVHTVGGAVQPAQMLMAIVPQDSPIVVEAQIRNQDVGFVHKGQRVDVKVDAFPFTEYGTLPGVIMSMSDTAVAPGGGDVSRSGTDAAPGGPPVYIARIALDRDTFMIGPCGDGRAPALGCRKYALHSGMSLQVEVKTGRRRIIRYLLSPLLRTTNEAGRER